MKRKFCEKRCILRFLDFAESRGERSHGTRTAIYLVMFQMYRLCVQNV